MVRRVPGFMNQLEKRIQRRLGIIKPKPKPIQIGTVTILSEQELADMIAKEVLQKVAESIKPGEPGWNDKGVQPNREAV